MSEDQEQQTNIKQDIDASADALNQTHNDLRGLEEAVADTPDMADYAPVNRKDILDDMVAIEGKTGQPTDSLTAWSARHAQGIANWKAQKTHEPVTKDNLAEKVRLTLDKKINE